MATNHHSIIPPERRRAFIDKVLTPAPDLGGEAYLEEVRDAETALFHRAWLTALEHAHYWQSLDHGGVVRRLYADGDEPHHAHAERTAMEDAQRSIERLLAIPSTNGDQIKQKRNVMRLVRAGRDLGARWDAMLAADVADYEARLSLKRASRKGSANHA